jgi:hypothetical protein
MTTIRKSITHEEHFIHIRGLDTPSGKFSDATVFARKEEDGKWFASIAMCSKVDQFSRKKGRQIARRHYFTQPAKRRFCIGRYAPTYAAARTLARLVP